MKKPDYLWRVTGLYWMQSKQTKSASDCIQTEGVCCLKVFIVKTNPIQGDTLLLHSKPSQHTGLTAAQLKVAVRAGRLPEPVRVGQRLRGWWQSDLDRLLATTPNTTPTTA